MGNDYRLALLEIDDRLAHVQLQRRDHESGVWRWAGSMELLTSDFYALKERTTIPVEDLSDGAIDTTSLQSRAA